MYVYEMSKSTEWTDDGPRTTYTFEFDFANKEEYLEQTAGWKADYKELSRRIRQHKLWRKPRHRPEDMSGWKNLSTLWTLQEQARMMCAMRTQAKAQASRQMVAQREAA